MGFSCTIWVPLTNVFASLDTKTQRTSCGSDPAGCCQTETHPYFGKTPTQNRMKPSTEISFSIAVMGWFVGSLHWHIDVSSLFT